jgi:hypothetical protein
MDVALDNSLQIGIEKAPLKKYINKNKPRKVSALK